MKFNDLFRFYLKIKIYLYTSITLITLLLNSVCYTIYKIACYTFNSKCFFNYLFYVMRNFCSVIKLELNLNSNFKKSKFNLNKKVFSVL